MADDVSGMADSVPVSGMADGVSESGMADGVSESGMAYGVSVSGMADDVSVPGMADDVSVQVWPVDSVPVSGMADGASESGMADGGPSQVWPMVCRCQVWLMMCRCQYGRWMCRCQVWPMICRCRMADSVPVSGMADGVPVSDMADGVPVTGMADGVSVSGMPMADGADGVSVSGGRWCARVRKADGVSESGVTDGVSVSGMDDDVPVSGMADGVPVSGMADGVPDVGDTKQDENDVHNVTQDVADTTQGENDVHNVTQDVADTTQGENDVHNVTQDVADIKQGENDVHNVTQDVADIKQGENDVHNVTQDVADIKQDENDVHNVTQDDVADIKQDENDVHNVTQDVADTTQDENDVHNVTQDVADIKQDENDVHNVTQNVADTTQDENDVHNVTQNVADTTQDVRQHTGDVLYSTRHVPQVPFDVTEGVDYDTIFTEGPLPVSATRLDIGSCQNDTVPVYSDHLGEIQGVLGPGVLKGPRYASFKQHLHCNLDTECQHGEDEGEHCSFSPPGCDGHVGYQNKCFVLMKGYQQLGTGTDKLCENVSGTLAMMKTRGEWEAFQNIFRYGKDLPFDVLIGMTGFDSHSPDYYRKSHKWIDNTVSYDLPITSFGLRKGKEWMSFNAEHPVPIIRTSLLFHGYVTRRPVCQFDAKLNYSVAGHNIQIPTLVRPALHPICKNITLVLCPDGHVTHDFLSSDPGSECGAAVSLLTRCTLRNTETEGNLGTELNLTVAMFTCDDGNKLHYTLVCDFRKDCQDNSDEDFCERSATCEGFTCKNGQCVGKMKVCDFVRNCVDGSDEDRCVVLQWRNRKRLSPPAVVDFQYGGDIVQRRLHPFE
ncbi:hypothetical protein BaRGS_00028144, partial [Batillaria attramentaria]